MCWVGAVYIAHKKLAVRKGNICIQRENKSLEQTETMNYIYSDCFHLQGRYHLPIPSPCWWARGWISLVGASICHFYLPFLRARKKHGRKHFPNICTLPAVYSGKPPLSSCWWHLPTRAVCRRGSWRCIFLCIS